MRSRLSFFLMIFSADFDTARAVPPSANAATSATDSATNRSVVVLDVFFTVFLTLLFLPAILELVPTRIRLQGSEVVVPLRITMHIEAGFFCFREELECRVGISRLRARATEVVQRGRIAETEIERFLIRLDALVCLFTLELDEGQVGPRAADFGVPARRRLVTRKHVSPALLFVALPGLVVVLPGRAEVQVAGHAHELVEALCAVKRHCLLYTSDAADERSSVDLGG